MTNPTPRDKESNETRHLRLQRTIVSGRTVPKLTGVRVPSDNQIRNRNALPVPAADEHSDEWRDEVASRLNRYRARRRPNPDLSFRFDFESQRQANRELVTGNLVLPGSSRKPAEIAGAPAVPATPPAHEIAALFADALEHAAAPGPFETAEPPADIETPAAEQNDIASPLPKPPRRRKIIEFPRPAAQFYVAPHELAEPVVQPPRILEALPIAEEDLLPVVPAITLDEAPQTAAEDLALELPLAPAPIGRRAAASLIDCGVGAAALALFAYVLLETSSIHTVPLGVLLHNRAAALAAGATAAVLWMGYHYMFLVWGEASAGVRAAGLELRTFDGQRASRRDRRRRAFAIVISALAGGLGFLWAVFDEDSLGWHDRISRTYIVAR
ncbi:MAG TPA: RDD family protein [Terriglobales bacterium]|nr:RDD family protein [Terriglobales bacterium]